MWVSSQICLVAVIALLIAELKRTGDVQMTHTEAARRLLKEYAEGDAETLQRHGGQVLHATVLITNPLCETAEEVMKVISSPEWQQFQQQQLTIECGGETVQLPVPAHVNNAEAYIEWLAGDPANGQLHYLEVYNVLDALVRWGVIKGPILRGTKQVDFIAFAPAFQELVLGPYDVISEHFEKMGGSPGHRVFPVAPPSYDHPIKVDLKVPRGDDWDKVWTKCQKRLQEEGDLYILLACNNVGVQKLRQLADSQQKRLILWYDSHLYFISLYSAGFWSYYPDF